MDFDFSAASDRHSVSGTCHRTSERRKPRQTHQTVTIVVRRLLISAAEGNRKGYDLSHVVGHLEEGNVKEILTFVSNKD